MRQFIRQDDGQDVAEYGLLIAAVGLLVLGSMSSFGDGLHAWFLAIATRLSGTVS